MSISVFLSTKLSPKNLTSSAQYSSQTSTLDFSQNLKGCIPHKLLCKGHTLVSRSTQRHEQQRHVHISDEMENVLCKCVFQNWSINNRRVTGRYIS
jgi:hypothetical protein